MTTAAAPGSSAGPAGPRVGPPPTVVDLRDDELRAELRVVYRTRAEVMRDGGSLAVVEHTRRMFELEHEYRRRFPRASLPAERPGDRRDEELTAS